METVCLSGYAHFLEQWRYECSLRRPELALHYVEQADVFDCDESVLIRPQHDSVAQRCTISEHMVLLLGGSTSISQEAIRALTSRDVLIGFAGSRGMPFCVGNELEWLGAGRCRQTYYSQQWMALWLDKQRRLQLSRQFCYLALTLVEWLWRTDYCHPQQLSRGGQSEAIDSVPFTGVDIAYDQVTAACSVAELCMVRERLHKRLLQHHAKRESVPSFVRIRHGEDCVNLFLTEGYQIALVFAARALWSSGIPQGCSLLHSELEKNALVKDLANIVMDAMIIPCAFQLALSGVSLQEFRLQCVQQLNKIGVLGLLAKVLQCDAEGIQDINRKD